MSSTQKQVLHELVDQLPEEKVPKIRHALEEAIRTGETAEDTRSALEKAEALGAVGCIEGPPDLSTNPDHMAGYGK